MQGLTLVFLSFFSLFSQYQLKNTYEFEMVYIEYGNLIHNEDSDGYVKIYDKISKELINEVVFDNFGYDVFNYLAIMGENLFVIVCDTYQSGDLNTLTKYRNSVLLLFDTSGNIQDRYYFEMSSKSVHNHNHHIIVKGKAKEFIFDKDLNIVNEIFVLKEYTGYFSYQFQGEGFINNLKVESILIQYPGNYQIKIIDKSYEFIFSIILHSDVQIVGTRFEDNYLSEVKIFGFGEMILNNSIYQSGSAVSQVGNYQLIITGENGYRKDYFFVIIPDIVYNEGIEQKQLFDGQEFVEPIRVYSNALTMLLDNEVYNSELIFTPGEYRLLFLGINGYELEIMFYILPQVVGLDKGGIYEEVEFVVNGSALLNGKSVSGRIKVDEVGEFRLDLLSEGKIYDSYSFTIKVEDVRQEFEVFEWIAYAKYGFILIAFVGVYFLYRNKKLINK